MTPNCSKPSQINAHAQIIWNTQDNMYLTNQIHNLISITAAQSRSAPWCLFYNGRHVALGGAFWRRRARFEHRRSCVDHRASPHFPSPSYHPPTIPSLLTSLHSLLLRIRVSGSCPILPDIGLQCVSGCIFLFSLPRPLGS